MVQESLINGCGLVVWFLVDSTKKIMISELANGLKRNHNFFKFMKNMLKKHKLSILYKGFLTHLIRSQLVELLDWMLN